MQKCVFVFILLNFYSFTASAQTWDETFQKDTVSTKLQGTGIRVMVAGAGEPVDEVKLAAASLVSALRENTQIELVMTDEALGNLALAADTTIVQNSATFKVNYIYVVRVFSKGEDGGYSVVATLYDGAGKAVDGLSGEKGVALTVASGAVSAGQGISNETSQAVSQVTEQSSVASDDAEKQYKERFVWFEDWVAINANTGAMAGRWTVPFKGIYKEQLGGKTFYSYINQPELAARYKKRNIVRWSVVGAGIGIFVPGMVIMMKSIKMDTDPCTGDYSLECREDPAMIAKEEDMEKKKKRRLIAGVILESVGLIAMLVPIYVSPHPIKPTERRKLVSEFNSNLKKELELPEDHRVTETSLLTQPENPHIRVGAAVGGRNTGLTFSMTF